MACLAPIVALGLAAHAKQIEAWEMASVVLVLGSALAAASQTRPGRSSNRNQRLRTSGIGTLASLTLAALVCGCATSRRGAPAIEGIPNLGQVNASLYRGGQPDREGIEALKRRGVRTVINLRESEDVWPAEEALVRAAGMRYFNIPMSGMSRPTDSQVLTVLSLIRVSGGPVFVHCRLGCDRTGTIVACYRLERDGWTRRAALKEAREFGISPWAFGMKRYIRDFSKTAALAEAAR